MAGEVRRRPYRVTCSIKKRTLNTVQDASLHERAKGHNNNNNKNNNEINLREPHWYVQITYSSICEAVSNRLVSAMAVRTEKATPTPREFKLLESSA
jgi:hypothetical protein